MNHLNFKIIIVINIMFVSSPLFGQPDFYTGLFESYDEIEENFQSNKRKYTVTVYQFFHQSAIIPMKEFKARYSFNEEGKLASVIKFQNLKKENNLMETQLYKKKIQYDDNYNIVSIKTFFPDKKISYQRKNKKRIKRVLNRINWKPHPSDERYKYDSLNNHITHLSIYKGDTIVETFKYSFEADGALKFKEQFFNNKSLSKDSFSIENDTIFQYKPKIIIYNGRENHEIYWPLWRVKYYNKEKGKYITKKKYNIDGLIEKSYDNQGNPIDEKQDNGKYFAKYYYKNDRLIRKKVFSEGKLIRTYYYEYADEI